MKKVLIFSLILSMVLCCCSCGDKEVKKNNPDDKVNSSTVDQTSSDDTVSDVESDNTLSDTESDSSGEGSNFNSSTDDYNSSLQNNSSNNSTSTKPTVVKDRLPDGTKIFDGNYDSYYTVTPKDEHPGVVNMDATYEMLIYDYSDKRISADDITLKVNNSKVTVIGTTLIIPYSVRKGYERVVVTVQNKKDSKKKGTYRFNFTQFTENNTFYDDFSEDDGTWGIDPYSPKSRLGVIRDGCMELTVDENKVGVRTSANGFEQAYGCFSASMKMPYDSNVCGAYWLFTGSGYIPNKESATDSAGEIDVIEFLTGPRKLMFTLHWFSYNQYHKENSTHFPVTFDAQKFATYSVVWTPQQIFWYVDGNLYKTATGVEEGVANGSRPLYMILQAGYVPQSHGFGFDSDDILPATVYVDWVEVFGLKID